MAMRSVLKLHAAVLSYMIQRFLANYIAYNKTCNSLFGVHKITINQQRSIEYNCALSVMQKIHIFHCLKPFDLSIYSP